MKKLFITIIFTAAACAAPLPERKGNVVKLVCDVPTQPEVATVLFYRAAPSDSVWTLAGSIPATSNTLTVSNSFYGETFYCTFATADGVESDPSNIATNTVTLSSPVKLKAFK
jgi:hypothetical protein